MTWTVTNNSWQYTSIYGADGKRLFLMDLEDWSVTEENQEALENQQADIARLAANAPALLEGALGLKRIVEEIDGAMNHGTWRDESGKRLKDTPEWVALYNAISAAYSLTPPQDSEAVKP